MPEKIAILGFGKEGQALADYFLSLGIKPMIFDEKLESLPEQYQDQFELISGADAFGQLGQEFDIVYRSPGVNYKKSELEYYYEKGLVSSLTNLIFEKTKAKIIGITGTKGKGTTASLLWQILTKCQNNKVVLGGNIGTTVLQEAMELTLGDWLVLELSSFQLADIKFSPNIAVVLGIESDHLDYHTNMAEYIEAKSSIVKFQKPEDWTVVNLDSSTANEVGKKSAGQKIDISLRRPLERGVYLSNEKIISTVGEQPVAIIAAGDVPVLGKFNLINICAAAAAALAAGCKPEEIAVAIVEFKPLQYRFEFVGEYGGRKYINDSASTNPTSSSAAINEINEEFVVIMGGKDKDLDFTPTAEVIKLKPNCQAVVLFGENQNKIRTALDQIGIKIISTGSLKEAVLSAIENSRPGSTILFSPASASFDQFKDAYERGEEFNKLIKNA